jgi:hypothetical protein
MKMTETNKQEIKTNVKDGELTGLNSVRIVLYNFANPDAQAIAEGNYPSKAIMAAATIMTTAYNSNPKEKAAEPFQTDIAKIVLADLIPAVNKIKDARTKSEEGLLNKFQGKQFNYSDADLNAEMKKLIESDKFKFLEKLLPFGGKMPDTEGKKELIKMYLNVFPAQEMNAKEVNQLVGALDDKATAETFENFIIKPLFNNEPGNYDKALQVLSNHKGMMQCGNNCTIYSAVSAADAQIRFKKPTEIMSAIDSSGVAQDESLKVDRTKYR